MKKLLLIIVIFMFSINVDAKEIVLTKDDYISYFEEHGFEISIQDCSEDIDELSNDCKIVGAYNKDNKIGLRLYEFNNNQDAYDYFVDVYDDNVHLLENVKIYNFNREEDSNYSYFNSKIADARSFDMVWVDNYVIKSNVEIEKSAKINEMYVELGFIKSEKNNTGIIFGIVFVIIALLTISILIVGKIIKKKRLNTGVK